ncbi:hypothetical protein T492DRAFT_831555 [Pavlovales sp. CCMP2436]|nr:hypothetical protein T492DRAFT_831555 [Pavlovales sp. CCMP2436]
MQGTRLAKAASAQPQIMLHHPLPDYALRLPDPLPDSAAAPEGGAAAQSAEQLPSQVPLPLQAASGPARRRGGSGNGQSRSYGKGNGNGRQPRRGARHAAQQPQGGTVAAGKDSALLARAKDEAEAKGSALLAGAGAGAEAHLLESVWGLGGLDTPADSGCGGCSSEHTGQSLRHQAQGQPFPFPSEQLESAAEAGRGVLALPRVMSAPALELSGDSDGAAEVSPVY